MKRLIVGLILVLSFGIAQAQTDSLAIIRGVVMDVLGKPLEGSTISLFGADEVERTDASGSFELKVENGQSTISRLMIRHMGYSGVQVPLNEFQGTRNSISVMLSPKRKDSRYIIR
jgi:hypothetical protein